MFYIMYLTNLCQRRRWQEPSYEMYGDSRRGYHCRVRVNNREYTCDGTYSSKELARDKAAESAYMICRNFSVNDGMYPGQKQGQAGVVQGLPVAIGVGRRSHRHKSDYDSSSSYSGSSSGGSSPRTSDSELDSSSRRSSGAMKTMPQAQPVACHCQRAYISRYGRCEYCMRDAGYA